MKTTERPPRKTAQLLDLADQGRVRDETDKPVSRRKLKRVKFPCFEDITPEEARTIARGAPRSGRFQRHHDYSLTGSAAALCARETK